MLHTVSWNLAEILTALFIMESVSTASTSGVIKVFTFICCRVIVILVNIILTITTISWFITNYKQNT